MKPLLKKLFFLSAYLGIVHLVSAFEVEVINAGKNGNNSRQILERFERDAIAHRPDIIILGGGTNDAINSRNSVELVDYIANTKSMILKSRESGIRLIVISGLPCIDHYVFKRHSSAFFQGEKPTERMRAYVQHLLELATEEQVEVINLFDLYQEKGLIGEGEGSWLQNQANSGKEDGVHPTPTGYLMIAKAVAQHLRQSAKAPLRIVCIGDSITFGAGARIQGDDQSYPAQLQRLLSRESPQE